MVSCTEASAAALPPPSWRGGRGPHSCEPTGTEEAGLQRQDHGERKLDF